MTFSSGAGATQSERSPAVREVLERYRGARVFFEPLAGNNGDILIEMGSRSALQQAGIELYDATRCGRGGYEWRVWDQRCVR